MREISGRFPSLETLDRINYKCMSYGFPFLTLGIITGSLWAELAWGSYWNWDPKETWSLITWIVYAVLIHNRLAIGWRGRRTAYMMIAGFVSVLITFIGVSFFLGRTPFIHLNGPTYASRNPRPQSYDRARRSEGEALRFRRGPRRSAERADGEGGPEEAVVLSTCNRTEVYATQAVTSMPGRLRSRGPDGPLQR